MATVELKIGALPSHVRTARLVAAAVARRCGADDAMIDEVKLAVGEACSRAVALHERHAPHDPVIIELTDGANDFLVAVLDCGPPGSESGLPADPAGTDFRQLVQASLNGPTDVHGRFTGPLPAHLGLAVIGGLVDELTVERDTGQTAVRMRWALVRPEDIRG